MINQKSIKSYVIILLALFLVACGDDPLDQEFEQYTGQYTIVSYKSDIAVDLNNDKSSSNELTDEITSFNFVDLEVRPLENSTNSAQLLSFFFPKTWLSPDAETGGSEDWANYISYGFGTTYHYENNSFVLKDKSYLEQGSNGREDVNRTVTINSDLEVVDSDHLKLLISKEYYDFKTGSWIMLDIEVVYERMVF